MDIFDLLDKLEEISIDNKTDCPGIYIQIGDMQASATWEREVLPWE